jgi:hypothetical protein
MFLLKKTNIYAVSISIALAFLGQQAFAQKISAAGLKQLKAKEDSLAEYSLYLNTDSLPEDRMIADSVFTKVLVRALQVKHSFHYPFDSVRGISNLYAPDSSFRVITWILSYDDYYSRQRGAIQMRTGDGALKLFPLRDFSEFTEKPLDSVRTRHNWIGAMYYNMVRTQHNGKNFYTLFGFDNNSVMSSMKWIEVLTFNNKGEPQFGGPFFSYEEDSIRKPTTHRFNIEFKKGTRVLTDYIPDLGVILVDHLISDPSNPDNEDPENKWTYVPDGDQEGFKWKNGKWVHIDKVFTFKLEDGQAPVEDPVMDNKGNRNEKKLQEKSDKNQRKNNERMPVNYDN